MPALFATADPLTLPLHVVAQDAFDDWAKGQPEATRNWAAAQGFTGALGQVLCLPDAAGKLQTAVAGYGTAATRARGRFALAAAAAKLPAGSYDIASGLPAEVAEVEALGWLLSGYRFDRYADKTPMAARLVAPKGIDATRVEALATGEMLTRDLINTPASDMGPPDLEAAARDLLIDMRWGDAGPKLTLVGKGVCFDTGGLNIKPGGSMGLMKKDMGGAAAVLGLAHMIMATGAQVQLRVLIPAVENSISGNAYRPQDILTSRKGLTVEINNTDAEGRLVLADALALADEDKPDQIISMATLTGAARVAVGPDLAPYFSDDPAFVTALENAAATVADPVWRMPFHTPYEPMIEPGIADLDNAPKGGFAGCITAALFLRRFVTDSPYAHFDIYGWQPSAAPARAKGGVGQATRALYAALPALFDT